MLALSLLLRKQSMLIIKILESIVKCKEGEKISAYIMIFPNTQKSNMLIMSLHKYKLISGSSSPK